MQMNYQIITSVMLIICMIALIFVFMAWDADIKALQEKVNKLGCEAIIANLSRIIGAQINTSYFNSSVPLSP
jgi:succinate dehydrogenase hydrophobic anchor subunit